MKNPVKNLISPFCLLLLAFFMTAAPAQSFAKSALEIDASVDTALQNFKTQVIGANEILAKSKGILVFPKIIKGGLGIGAEYGVGALRIDGKTVDYYNNIGGSFGFQWGGQVKSVYLFFLEEKALRDFRNSDGWKVGVDGSVALITIGADASVDTMKTNQPIIAYVLGQKGLMGNLTIEGSKYNRIVK